MKPEREVQERVVQVRAIRGRALVRGDRVRAGGDAIDHTFAIDRDAVSGGDAA
eukprot:COSAG02_NODE_236_length_27740_cov_49.156073_5_plen_53_part_00